MTQKRATLARMSQISSSLSRRALAAAALVAPAAACATVLDIQASFDWSWRNHIEAVQARDLDKLARTITSGDTLVLILPDGRYTTTKAAYLEFHRDWFASTSWTMAFEPIWQKQSTTMGQVLLRTRYSDTVSGAAVNSQSYLMLTFEREASDWKLIAGQNTRFQA